MWLKSSEGFCSDRKLSSDFICHGMLCRISKMCVVLPFMLHPQIIVEEDEELKDGFCKWILMNGKVCFAICDDGCAQRWGLLWTV